MRAIVFSLMLTCAYSCTHYHQEPTRKLYFCRNISDMSPKPIIDEWHMGASVAPLAVATKPERWENGTSLKVWFYDGDLNARTRVLTAANKWSRHANIKFEMVNDIIRSDIRISFNGNGFWSYIGQEVQRHDTSMSLEGLDTLQNQPLFKSIVLHEFGHSLGCLHEHQSPKSHINWNKPAVYAFYAQPPNCWSRGKVDTNVFLKYSYSQTSATNFDPYSIMQYAIPETLLIDQPAIPWNYDLSGDDTTFISKIYPKKLNLR